MIDSCPVFTRQNPQVKELVINHRIITKMSENSHSKRVFGQIVAEGAGFEPAWSCPLTVFKTAPL